MKKTATTQKISILFTSAQNKDRRISLQIKKLFISNLIVFVLFLIVAFLLWTLETDGTGAIQTNHSRLFTELVWGAFYLLILALQMLFILIKKAIIHDK